MFGIFFFDKPIQEFDYYHYVLLYFIQSKEYSVGVSIGTHVEIFNSREGAVLWGRAIKLG